MSDTTIATKLVQNDSRRGYQFAILEGENHQFYAVRSSIPYFCFEADTVKEATAVASRAIEFYWTAQKDGENKDAAAKALYTRDCDNHPTVHSNRFATWDELNHSVKEVWRERARHS